MKALKFFIILFFILCLASLLVTVTLSFLRENEKVKRMEVEKQVDLLEAEKKGLAKRNKTLKEEAATAKEQLAVQTKMVENFKGKVHELEQMANELEEKAESNKERLTNLRKEYNEYRNSSSKIIEDYKSQNKQLLKQLGRIEGEMVESRQGDYDAFGNFYPSEPVEPLNEPETGMGVELEPVVVTSDQTFSGRVMVVNRKFNFIIANIGQEDGLQIGNELFVFRDGRKIATLKVEKLYDKLSASAIVQEEAITAIQEGDVVGN